MRSEEPARRRSEDGSEKAPEVFQANLDTSKGPVVIEVHRDWAPIGADHFYNLVKTGFYDDGPVLPRGAEFRGAVRDQRRSQNQSAVVHRQSARRSGEAEQRQRHGDLCARRGPNSRTTQLFINLKDNRAGARPTGFAPIGKVIDGNGRRGELLQQLRRHAAARAGAGSCKDQMQGNEYLANHFPRLDYHQKSHDSMI